MGVKPYSATESRDLLKFGVVILAAGASSRMGRPKLLLPWGETSILGHLIRQWQSATQIAVVCAEGDRALTVELDRVGFPASTRIINPQPDRGMFSSVRCAALWDDWAPELSHWVIVLGDQPHLRSDTLASLIEFAATHPERVCQPGWNGRPRHPVVIPRPVFQRLKDSTADNLKQFLQQQDVALCPMDDPGLDFDVDTPADYERALQFCFMGHR